MYRDSYYNKIINLIKINPLSQNEIHRLLKREKITVQGIANHLSKGIEEGKIIYLGNLVSKKDARYFLKYKFDRKWPVNAWQCYVFTPETNKMSIRLKEQFGDKDQEIKEIVKHYRELEFASMFQEIEFYNFKIVKNWKKFKRTYTNDDAVKQAIIKKEKEVNEFYENRNKEDRILEFSQLTPIMYWCAFKRVIPVEHPQYDLKKDIVSHTTVPMFKKMEELFSRMKNGK